MMKAKRWSPYPAERYAVKMPDGKLVGLGALPLFKERPGLWNLMWLHSIRVDRLLDWPYGTDDIPIASAVLPFIIESADYMCNSQPLEFMAETLTAQEFVDCIKACDCHPPVRDFWDDIPGGWVGFVDDRLSNHVGLRQQKGNVVSVNFSCGY